MNNITQLGFALESQYHLNKASKSRNGIASIEGILSTQSKDTQGEEIFIKGMDITLLNGGMAQLNWWHLGTKDPSMIVGLFDRAAKTNNETSIDFEAHILDTPQGHAVLDLMIALEAEGKRIGVSVEGQVIARQANRIYKSIARGGALATDQINKECTAHTTQIIKALEGYSPTLIVDEEMYKAIGVTGDAPYGTNPVIQQLSLGSSELEKITFEEAVNKLKLDYQDLSEEFIRQLLADIYARKNN